MIEAPTYGDILLTGVLSAFTFGAWTAAMILMGFWMGYRKTDQDVFSSAMEGMDGMAAGKGSGGPYPPDPFSAAPDPLSGEDEMPDPGTPSDFRL